ncbi:hypothetical protein F511_41249 [Dorcoceras hygrometricum]|uniref:Uncharacterized protein n=1 Tax=Dorcoceras hygrometricum TaxID=472368 RepID=A0A2Z7A094_9LAMI|nr:hypothetical protein F511_41249 [Dorcoceras hygrometricum]
MRDAKRRRTEKQISPPTTTLALKQQNQISQALADLSREQRKEPDLYYAIAKTRRQRYTLTNTCRHLIQRANKMDLSREKPDLSLMNAITFQLSLISNRFHQNNGATDLIQKLADLTNMS